VFGTSHCQMFVQKRATQTQTSVDTYYMCIQGISRTGWNVTCITTVKLLHTVTEILRFLNNSLLKLIYNCYFTFFVYSLISKFTALPFFNLLTYKQTFLFRFLRILCFFLKILRSLPLRFVSFLFFVTLNVKLKFPMFFVLILHFRTENCNEAANSFKTVLFELLPSKLWHFREVLQGFLYCISLITNLLYKVLFMLNFFCFPPHLVA
jgi:hypothetical protein